MKDLNLFLVLSSSLSMVQLTQALALVSEAETASSKSTVQSGNVAELAAASSRELTVATSSAAETSTAKVTTVGAAGLPNGPVHRRTASMSGDQLRTAAITAAATAQGKKAALPVVVDKDAESRARASSSPGSAFRAVGGGAAIERLDLAQLDLTQASHVQKLQERLDQLCAVAETQRIALTDLTAYQQRVSDRLGQKVGELEVKEQQRLRKLNELSSQLESLKRAIYATDPAVRDLSVRVEGLERQVRYLADNLSAFAERLGCEARRAARVKGGAQSDGGASEASVLPLLSVSTNRTHAANSSRAGVDSAMSDQIKIGSDGAGAAVTGDGAMIGDKAAVAALVDPIGTAVPVVTTPRWGGLSHKAQWALLGVTAAGVAYAKRQDGCCIS